LNLSNTKNSRRFLSSKFKSLEFKILKKIFFYLFKSTENESEQLYNKRSQSV
jgi:hypothetical protein